MGGALSRDVVRVIELRDGEREMRRVVLSFLGTNGALGGGSLVIVGKDGAGAGES